MDNWKEGEPFKSNSDIEIINGIVKECTGGCNSEKCRAREKKKNGYTSGFGRLFDVDVVIKDGFVDRAINIRKE